MTENWRKVDTAKSLKPEDFSPGPAPMLQWIDIDLLVVDDSYQRPLERSNWNAIKRIARNFQWSRFSPVFVAPVEGGKFAIIDGQHRTHAAAAVGVEQVPCQVVTMNLKEQAAAFAAVNGTVTKVTIWQIYKAALTAGEEWATTASAIAEEGGCRLMTRNGSTVAKKPGEIYGIRMFCEVVQRYKRDVIVLALKSLLKTEGVNDNSEAWAAQTFKPMLNALCQRPKALKAPDFCEKFESFDFWALEDEIAAENRRRIRAGSNSLPKAEQMEVGILEWIDKTYPERIALPASMRAA